MSVKSFGDESQRLTCYAAVHQKEKKYYSKDKLLQFFIHS